MKRVSLLLAALLFAGCARAGCASRSTVESPNIDRFAREPVSGARIVEERRLYHPLRLDERGSILSWSTDDAPYHHVVSLGFGAFAEMRAGDPEPPYFIASMFTPQPDGTFAPEGWLHNPAGLAAMLVRSSLRYRGYAGDNKPLERTRVFVDHVLAHGRTREDDAWSLVAYASGNGGDREYRGGDDKRYCKEGDACGRGDGPGFLEPDKVGELGHALLLLFEATGEARYLEAAVRSADALAKHVTPGDAKHSPWPFRVDAKTGTIVREPYGSNVVFAIALFDELDRIGRATDAHRSARDLAWSWLQRHPLKTMHWQGYFEDIPIHIEPGTNPNQYSAGETARYLLAHPERDPEWRSHVEAIVAWTAKTFGGDVDAPIGVTPGVDHGAEVISEQGADMAKMGSHTARFASILALLHEKTGDPALRARAFRSFNWATYCVDHKGVVKVSPDDREGYWFSDGYGDYMTHFLDGMAAIPAWAPRDGNHLLRSTSTVTEATYSATEVHYSLFDESGTEELRLASVPRAVDAGDGAKIVTQNVAAGGVHLTIERHGARSVRIEFGS